MTTSEPDPLVEPEHRPDSEWADGEQPVPLPAPDDPKPPAADETQLMLRPDFSDD